MHTVFLLKELCTEKKLAILEILSLIGGKLGWGRVCSVSVGGGKNKDLWRAQQGSGFLRTQSIQADPPEADDEDPFLSSVWPHQVPARSCECVRLPSIF
jgi:hypothetical protein